MRNNSPCFLVDAMLGNLAKKLRLLGFDAIYLKDIDDKSILDIAKSENRILVTKDLELNHISNKMKIESIFIKSESQSEQIQQIKKHTKINNLEVNMDKIRCSICNSKLIHTNPTGLQELIPPFVEKNFKDFWICKNCKKVYWKGSHFDNLKNYILKINEKIQ